MPITFNCACGKTLRVPDTSAGKRAKCPACAAVVTVPAPEIEPVFEIVEAPAPKPVVPPPLPVAKKPFLDDDDDDGGTYGLATPEREDPVSGGGSSANGSAPKKKLPNFRIGTDNRS